MSLTLINKSGRAELKLDPYPRERYWRSRPCRGCGQWIFIRDSMPVEHRYLAEHKPVPFVNVTLQVTIHNCNGSDCNDDEAEEEDRE